MALHERSPGSISLHSFKEENLPIATATLTSKGQLTLPKAVRDQLNLHRGDRLDVFVDEAGLIVLKPVTVEAAELYGILPRPSRSVSFDEMDDAIRKRAPGRE
ncbi:MAG: AbrB/MazE/SpoVT family DNA-binding domain-containing protein [Thiotrichales bacterium]